LTWHVIIHCECGGINSWSNHGKSLKESFQEVFDKLDMSAKNGHAIHNIMFLFEEKEPPEHLPGELPKSESVHY